MVSVTALASRPKISKIIIDSDLNMGEFDVTATDVTATGNLKVEGGVDGDLDVTGNVTATGNVSGNNIVASGSLQAGSYIVKGNYTISPATPSTSTTITFNGTGYHDIMVLPPNVTMSGTIKLYAVRSGFAVDCFDVNGFRLSSDAVPTSTSEVTIPTGTNKISLYAGSATGNVYFYSYKIE